MTSPITFRPDGPLSSPGQLLPSPGGWPLASPANFGRTPADAFVPEGRLSLEMFHTGGPADADPFKAPGAAHGPQGGLQKGARARDRAPGPARPRSLATRPQRSPPLPRPPHSPLRGDDRVRAARAPAWPVGQAGAAPPHTCRRPG